MLWSLTIHTWRDHYLKHNQNRDCKPNRACAHRFACKPVSYRCEWKRRRSSASHQGCSFAGSGRQQPVWWGLGPGRSGGSVPSWTASGTCSSPRSGPHRPGERIRHYDRLTETQTDIPVNRAFLGVTETEPGPDLIELEITGTEPEPICSHRPAERGWIIYHIQKNWDKWLSHRFRTTIQEYEACCHIDSKCHLMKFRITLPQCTYRIQVGSPRRRPWLDI